MSVKIQINPDGSKSLLSEEWAEGRQASYGYLSAKLAKKNPQRLLIDSKFSDTMVLKQLRINGVCLSK